MQLTNQACSLGKMHDPMGFEASLRPRSRSAGRGSHLLMWAWTSPATLELRHHLLLPCGGASDFTPRPAASKGAAASPRTPLSFSSPQDGNDKLGRNASLLGVFPQPRATASESPGTAPPCFLSGEVMPIRCCGFGVSGWGRGRVLSSRATTVCPRWKQGELERGCQGSEQSCRREQGVKPRFGAIVEKAARGGNLS